MFITSKILLLVIIFIFAKTDLQITEPCLVFNASSSSS